MPTVAKIFQKGHVATVGIDLATSVEYVILCYASKEMHLKSLWTRTSTYQTLHGGSNEFRVTKIDLQNRDLILSDLTKKMKLGHISRLEIMNSRSLINYQA